MQIRVGGAAALALASATTVVALGCGSSSRTAVGPSPVKCQFSVTASSTTMAASGGAGNVTVTTSPECAWTASTDATWISGLSPASGQGVGRVEFVVAANSAPASRAGDIILNGERIRIQQSAADCTFDVSPLSAAVGPVGGAVTISVAAADGCSWAAVSQASWVSVGSSSGAGSGLLVLQAGANTGATRTGMVTIGGKTVIVTQTSQASSPAPPSPGCSYAIAPVAFDFGSEPASGTVTISAGFGCAWTASSVVPWVVITSSSSATGNGSITFDVSRNPGGARTASLTVANHTVAVAQSGVPCAVTISPTSLSMAADAGSGTVAVSAPGSCGWSASSNVTWLTFPTGAVGTGNGSLSFNAVSNPGPMRSGLITVGGQTITVSQAGGCSYAINPTSQPVAAAGGAGAPIGVSTTAGCAWSATSNAPWLTVSGAAAGTGSGTVSFSVGANTGAARTGTLTVAGLTFTVSQGGGCTYSITPTSQSVPKTAATGSVAVSTASGCSWTATSNDSWITIGNGSTGSGNGNVQYNVSANTGSKARTGTVTIAGQTFTITQAKQ